MSSVGECLSRCRTRCFSASPAGRIPPLTDFEALERYQRAAMELVESHPDLADWMASDGMRPSDPVHAMTAAFAAASETVAAYAASAIEV